MEEKIQEEKEEQKGRGGNLTNEDRARGGKHSAAAQERDEIGQFAGKKKALEIEGEA